MQLLSCSHQENEKNAQDNTVRNVKVIDGEKEFIEKVKTCDISAPDNVIAVSFKSKDETAIERIDGALASCQHHIVNYAIKQFFDYHVKCKSLANLFSGKVGIVDSVLFDKLNNEYIAAAANFAVINRIDSTEYVGDIMNSYKFSARDTLDYIKNVKDALQKKNINSKYIDDLVIYFDTTFIPIAVKASVVKNKINSVTSLPEQIAQSKAEIVKLKQDLNTADNGKPLLFITPQVVQRLDDSGPGTYIVSFGNRLGVLRTTETVITARGYVGMWVYGCGKEVIVKDGNFREPVDCFEEITKSELEVINSQQKPSREKIRELQNKIASLEKQSKDKNVDINSLQDELSRLTPPAEVKEFMLNIIHRSKSKSS